MIGLGGSPRERLASSAGVKKALEVFRHLAAIRCLRDHIASRSVRSIKSIRHDPKHMIYQHLLNRVFMVQRNLRAELKFLSDRQKIIVFIYMAKCMPVVNLHKQFFYAKSPNLFFDKTISFFLY